MEALLEGDSAHKRKGCAGLSAGITEGPLGLCTPC